MQTRSRRATEYSSYYDEEGDGAMFSGPGHSANPSSVSRMSHIELGRKSSDMLSRSRRKSVDSRAPRLRRRDSRDSQVSRQTVDDAQTQDDLDDLSLGEDAESSRPLRGRQKSLSPQRKSMFENLANIFGRQSTEEATLERRPSISHRSSMSRLSRRSSRAENGLETDPDEEERWGYSSGEEDSDNESMGITPDTASITQSMNYDSEPPSPVQASQTLPLLGFDSVFDGEARIDMDTTFTLLDPPPPGPPSRQTVYITDEDTTIRFIGYETIFWRDCLWRISCIITLGIMGLLGHWFPNIWLRWVAREKAFIDSKNGFLVVEVCILWHLMYIHSRHYLSHLIEL